MHNDSQKPESKFRLNFMLVIISLLIAVAAGLYALYGISGKPKQLAEANSCNISDQQRAKLDAAAHGEVAAFNLVDVPSSLSALSFKDENGQQKTLADWKGRVVLLNLWATWCAPCRREMPALDALEKKLGSDEFQVLPISIDQGGDEKPKEFYRKIGLKTLPFFHDGTMDTFTQLKKKSLALGLPSTLLINEEGCVIGNLNGPAEWASEDAIKLVRAALSPLED